MFKKINIFIKDRYDIVGAFVFIDSLKKTGLLLKFIALVKKISNDFDDLLKIFFDDIKVIKKKDHYYESNSLLLKYDIVYEDIKKNIFYFIEKPYKQEGNISISERKKIKEYVIWFSLYREILNKNFYLSQNKYFIEPTNLLKYFSPLLSFILTDTKKIKYNDKNISKLFNHEITKNEMYYYTDISKEYIMKNKIINEKIDTPLELDDLGCLYYLKNTDNTFIILMVNNEIIDDELEKYIFYKKECILNNYDLKNLLFITHTHYVYDERYEYLNNKYKDDKYKVIALFVKMDVILKSDYDKDFYISYYNKSTIAPLLLHNETIFDFIKLSKNILKNLKYQSLKKWLSNNYVSYDKLIIYWLKNDDFIIIDNNEYEDLLKSQILLNDSLLFFMKIYFNRSDSSIIKNYNLDMNKYEILEDINFIIEK
jgi:hypothetical protein